MQRRVPPIPQTPKYAKELAEEAQENANVASYITNGSGVGLMFQRYLR